jgi:hypothetical protein
MAFRRIVFIGSPTSSPFDLKSARRAALWAFTSGWKSGHEIDPLTASLDPHTAGEINCSAEMFPQADAKGPNLEVGVYSTLRRLVQEQTPGRSIPAPLPS